ncbi:MAG: hypothetical protein M2R45_02129 [Verrucomicrobia subdivision 3 bacterium]|nr:hypothetical protein [Limisphaerales bacterium]MCS1413814.1 hypothetical protein [Limisphaerales bacterium]
MFKSILAIIAISMAIPSATAAEEGKAAKKERTTRGVLVCAKCSLGKTESCQAALTINRKNKQGEKIERVFLLKNNDVTKAFHNNICSGDKVPVKVTGDHEGKRKDRVIVASKIEKTKARKKAS